MKRFGNLWSEISSRENVEKAVCAALVHQRENAQKRKFLENREFYTDEICNKLQNGTFEFSPLYEFKVYEPKERIIHCPTHTLLRKRIKMNIKKKSNRLKNADDDTWKMQMASYYGWLKHCNGKNLLKTIKGDRMIEYKKLSEKRPRPSWFDVPKEQRESIMALCESGREIVFIEYMEVEIKKEKKVVVKYIYADENCDNPTFHTFITKSAVIMDRLANDKELMPFSARIIKKKNYLCYE